MKRKKPSWPERLMRLLKPPDQHHRICRKCHKPIKKHHRWHQLKVGWFSVTYAVEHNDCNNPAMETPHQRAMRLGPELPFDETADAAGNWNAADDQPVPIWPGRDDAPQGRLQ